MTEPADIAARGPRLDHGRYTRESVVPMSPAALLLGALFLLPIGYAFYLGLTNLQFIGANSIHYRFTGTTNIVRLWRDTEFLHSPLLTLYFVVGAGAVASTAAGLALAMLMERSAPSLRSAVGALAMLACILPPATVAVVWFAVTTEGGVFPWMLGMGKTDLLYSHPMLIVSAANAWSLCGLSMLMFAAALARLQIRLRPRRSRAGLTAPRSTRHLDPDLRPWRQSVDRTVRRARRSVRDGSPVPTKEEEQTMKITGAEIYVVKGGPVTPVLLELRTDACGRCAPKEDAGMG